MNTVALELVPPNVEGGHEKAAEELHKLRQFSAEFGIDERIDHVMIPSMIAEDSDRPLEMKPKLDVVDYWSIIRAELPAMRGLCTQVTSFSDETSLRGRLTDLTGAGMDGVIFVGVPRTMADGDGAGIPPTDALSKFDDIVTNRGVILIPTRAEEQGRFSFKCDKGRDLRHDAAAVFGCGGGLFARVRARERSPARGSTLLWLRSEAGVQGRSHRLADSGSR